MALKRIVVPAAIKLSVRAAWIVRRASMSNGIGGLHGASSVRLAIKRVFEHAPRLYLEPEMKFRWTPWKVPGLTFFGGTAGGD
jgi:hypothetical protein